MKYTKLTIISGVLMIVPTLVCAQTTDTSALQAQIQTLLQQVAQLQAQVGGNSSAGVSTPSGATVTNTSTNTAANTPVSGTANTSNATCPLIGRSLKLGSSGDDVARLQAFLALESDVYPEAQTTGYFGQLTQAAVRRWQAKYNVVSAGTPATTGYGMVGPRTAAAISLLCVQRAAQGGTSGSTGATVGGYIQVSPVSGNAPLTVSINAVINTVNNCTPSTYVLDFGDGTPFQQQQSTSCNQQTQLYSHTYTTPGVYQITLSAGTHRTTATVAVGGVASGGTNTTQDSIRASISQGNAPLTVVFSGTVSSAAGQNCQGTCNETINYGDGAVALIPIPTTAGTWQTYTVNHTYAAPGRYTVQLQSPTGQTLGTPITITVYQSSTASTTPTSGTYQIVSVNPDTSTARGVGVTVNVPAGVMYSIDWGDGIILNAQAPTVGGTITVPTHSYTAVGSFTVALKDAAGATQASAVVTIQ